MADRPILFSAPMVRALLAGTKTQTRRLLMTADEIEKGPWLRVRYKEEADIWQVGLEQFNSWKEIPVRYRVGDRLYVREAWRAEAVYDDTPPRDIPDDACMIRYEADGAWSDHDAMTHAGRFRQGMHMPRWASRLTLAVTDVRVQRLQEISEEDAEAEGFTRYFDTELPNDWIVDWYKELWDNLNADRAPWKSNPWVVAVSFDVKRCNIDEVKS